MSKLSDSILAGTSKGACGQLSPAAIMLEDGFFLEGRACGAPGEVYGEACFNTSLEGYFEVITDPSYAGQIITLTYPQIGNYGINSDDAQAARPAARGLVVRDLCATPSNFRSSMPLGAYLREAGIVAIEGVDTRALVRHIRDAGAMRAVLSTTDTDPQSLLAKVRASKPLVGQNFVSEVSAPDTHATVAVPKSQAFAINGEGGGTSGVLGVAAGVPSEATQPSSTPTPTPKTPATLSNLAGDLCHFARSAATPRLVAQSRRNLEPGGDQGRDKARYLYKVVAYDCGMKDGILQNLLRAGCDVRVVAWDTPAADVLAMQPDGVFLSNGPGDPDAVEGTYSQVEQLLGRVPVFGICLGHQMISLAAGAQIEKLKFGHRGGNHPVMNLRTGRVEITAQNHGFGCKFDSLGPLVADMSGGCQNHVDDLRFWAARRIAPVVLNPRFGRIQLTHVNLNDGTPEGIAFLDIPAFCVQYHPEASPGPTDSHYLFSAFTRLMDGRDDYLDIDIAKDRLAGWRFGATHLPLADSSDAHFACHSARSSAEPGEVAQSRGDLPVDSEPIDDATHLPHINDLKEPSHA